MSRRPFGAVNADLCANSEISRRQLIAGSAATAIISDLPVGADPAVQACQAWFDLEAQHQALLERWQKLETNLIRMGYWRDYSSQNVVAMPEARELEAIDDLLDALDAKKRELLAKLPEIEATTAHGLVLKLDVLASVVRPDEARDLYDLVVSIQCNLKTMII